MSFLLKPDGTVWSWGYTATGVSLFAENRDSPEVVVGGMSFVQIAVGLRHLLGLMADGTAWASGGNPSGQLGDNSRNDRSSPVAVVGGHSFTAVSAGSETSAGLKADGSVWMWGLNPYGELGNLSKANSYSSPVLVVGAHSFVDVSCGANYTLARKADGSVWGWGQNSSSGVLGNQTQTNTSSPVAVVGGHSFVSVAAGYIAQRAMAMKSDGSVWVWGVNTNGCLGVNDLNPRSSPTVVAGGHAFTEVAGTGYVTVALKADGSAWTWGYNLSGQCGTGVWMTNNSSPVAVIGAHSFIHVATGGTLVVYGQKADGTIWGWGATSGSGSIGTANYMSMASPVLAVASCSLAALPRHSHMSGWAAGLKADGTAWTWGWYSGAGPIGSSWATSWSSPVLVTTGVVRLAGGPTQRYAITEESHKVWGTNGFGQLGNLSCLMRSVPVVVAGGHDFVNISGGGMQNAAGLKADGSVWTWGWGSSGVLGNNDVGPRSSPVAVVGAHSFILVSARSIDLMCALKADGSAWTWGRGSYGGLGNNSTANQSSPVAVVGSHSFIYVVVDCASVRGKGLGPTVLALKADGSVWGWGSQGSGQLGDQSKTARSSPIPVVGGHSFVQVELGGVSAYALKANGEVWAWGNNDFGQLGNQTRTGTSSPVLVVGSHSFVEIAAFDLNTPVCTYVEARKANGEVWVWGTADAGLGTGSTFSASSPVLVAGAHAAASLGVRFPLTGVAWGTQLPAAKRRALSWTRDWGGSPSGDPDWGDLPLSAGANTSPVVDTGTDLEKQFTLTATEDGTSTKYLRGSLTLFAAADASPSWEAYSGAVNKTWRWVQVKVEV